MDQIPWHLYLYRFRQALWMAVLADDDLGQSVPQILSY